MFEILSCEHGFGGSRAGHSLLNRFPESPSDFSAIEIWPMEGQYKVEKDNTTRIWPMERPMVGNWPMAGQWLANGM